MARHRSSRRRAPRRTTGCRDSHTYRAGHSIGAGIIRYVCRRCGAVSIDITGVDTLSKTGSLFEQAEGTLERT